MDSGTNNVLETYIGLIIIVVVMACVGIGMLIGWLFF